MNTNNKFTLDDKLNIYSGFHPLSQIVLNTWEKRVISIGEGGTFSKEMSLLNQQLEERNIILFFDHHYAFDALPLGVAIGRYISRLAEVIIPYAVHLDMGLGREGEFSIRYWIRTRAFQWFVHRIVKGNSQIKFFPVVREFELETPLLKLVVEKEYEGINTAYLRAFIRRFSEKSCRQVCFLTPFSGIGFPGKPVLHAQLFRSIQMVLAKTNHNVSFFMTGAYPDWNSYDNYLAPLFMEHKVLLRGPFELSCESYKAASVVVEKELEDLRNAAGFVIPDYSKLLMK